MSVETEFKEENHLVKEEEIYQVLYDICENRFKSQANLSRHDQRFHVRQGTVNKLKYDFCTETFADKMKLCDHIANIHKKCALCDKRFSTTEYLETHILAVHKKFKLKHKIERYPNMKNHKNNQYN